MNQLFDMSNRVAVVTGSTKGMGLAIARALGAAGARIVISGRSEETAKAVADQCHSEGITAKGLGCDITDIESVRRFAKHAQEAFGEVDVLLASGHSNGSGALREAATAYKVDTDAIALKVKQEFAVKEKAKKEAKPTPSGVPKNRKAA
jgi:NAD(P)-dependent dehydrogenase (short-subunit alcohol dehydrogenase family)